ncbi:MAG TPA: hypothetical protein VNU93_06635 [Verrucomicrobiae bacterium]|nr:hypothetical protein [Verrucomicrobiae bacterium]
MDQKMKEAMQRLIDAKKEKSASQSGLQRTPNTVVTTRPGIKKHKKGGLFDK